MGKAAKDSENVAPNQNSLGQATLDKDKLEALYEQTRRVYLADSRPWVIGYSGGKDSTTCLQIVWYALAGLPADKVTKPVYVISSDTLVESPVIVQQIKTTLARIEAAAKGKGLPFYTDIVTPQVTDTFWVNLIGRGYPAPYKRFRWCTDRLKIQPANRFIMSKVAKYGEVVLVLGVRRSESATRAQVMSLHRRHGESLSRHSDLTSAWVYTPIEDWSVNDVWTYLLTCPSPWGNENRELVTMYRNAQAGECPLVVDTKTSSCGNSRFGCWTCTVVDRDKTMEALIENGEDWMEPMLELRDWLSKTQDPSKKREIRDFRRRDGHVHLWGDNKEKIIWGPFKFEFRKDILRRLLRVQKAVQASGPDPETSMISMAELEEIRRLWRVELSDWEDCVPRIFEEEIGTPYKWLHDDLSTGSAMEAQALEQVASNHDLPPKLISELIDIERSLNGMHRRSTIYDRIDIVLRKDWRSEQEVLSGIPALPQEDEGEDEGEPSAS
jgi:DNA sulfur modification protein DndC